MNIIFRKWKYSFVRPWLWRYFAHLLVGWRNTFISSKTSVFTFSKASLASVWTGRHSWASQWASSKSGVTPSHCIGSCRCRRSLFVHHRFVSSLTFIVGTSGSDGRECESFLGVPTACGIPWLLQGPQQKVCFSTRIPSFCTLSILRFSAALWSADTCHGI